MVAAPYSTGGKNEKEEIASLVIVCGRPSLTRMRNDSWHGGRYTETRESREKDSLRIRRDSENSHCRFRIGPQTLLLAIA
jgi:hypothetical protein